MICFSLKPLNSFLLYSDCNTESLHALLMSVWPCCSLSSVPGCLTLCLAYYAPIPLPWQCSRTLTSSTFQGTHTCSSPGWAIHSSHLSLNVTSSISLSWHANLKFCCFSLTALSPFIWGDFLVIISYTHPPPQPYLILRTIMTSSELF